MKKRFLLALIGSAITLSGCGGSSSTNTSTSSSSDVQTGQVIDSAIAGLEYETQTQSGVTNSAGEFQYKNGELITFKVGDIKLPAIPAEKLLSPLSFFKAVETSDTRVLNLSRLLQTLDVDGNPENGIEINTQMAKSASTGATLDFSSKNFSKLTQVINFMSNGGGKTNILVAEAAAKEHLEASLKKHETAPTFTNEYLASNSPWYSVALFEGQGVVPHCGGKTSFTQEGGFSSRTDYLTVDGQVQMEVEESSGTFQITSTATGVTQVQSTDTKGQQSNPTVVSKVRTKYWISVGSSADGSILGTQVLFNNRADAVSFASSKNASSNCDTYLPQ